MGTASTRIRSLETARQCAELGACKRTISWVTGLAPYFILRTLYDDEHPAPKGRPPYQGDFYFRLTLRLQAEASSFAVKYRALVVAGFLPSESLVTAYRHYLSLTSTPAFGFDEAFNLVAHLDGIWAVSSPSLQLCLCRRCGSDHLAPIGSLPSNGCAFCKLSREDADPASDRSESRRTSARRTPPSALGRVSDAFPIHIDAMRYLRDLEELGAHTRVISALLSCLPTPFFSPAPVTPRSLVSIGSPLSMHRWGEAVKPPLRARYGLVATHYRRLVRCGFPAEQSLLGAYRHVRTLVPEHPISFNRCFEVVSLLEGRWGAPEPELALEPCGKCGAHHLVSRRDPTPGSSA